MVKKGRKMVNVAFGCPLSQNSEKKVPKQEQTAVISEKYNSMLFNTGQKREGFLEATVNSR